MRCFRPLALICHSCLPLSRCLSHIHLSVIIYASSTVNTYISALSYSHKLSGLPDPTRVFYIIQMLKGYGKNRARLDSRLPITLPILQRLIEVSPRLTGSQYQICQFKAMCCLAFFAFLKIGEMTATNNAGDQPFNYKISVSVMTRVTKLLVSS